MKKFIEGLIACSVWLALRFRYNIKVVGFEKLTKENLSRPGGILFLPNHPSYFVDPCVATLSVWPKYSIRPMVVEYMYYTPGFYTVLKIMDALPVPNFASSTNSLKKKKIERALQSVVDGIKKGENFSIAPAGRVKYTGYEFIGGASAVHKVLQDAPEANVVLIRMKGLWGSRFSRALEQDPPSLGRALMWSLGVILKNLIIFTPRRKVVVELMPAPKDFPRNMSRMELNRWLEAWYNKPDGLTKQEGDEPGDSLVRVSYSRWYKDLLPVKKKREENEEEISLSAIPEVVRSKVLTKLSELAEVPKSSILPEQTLATDLGLDSLDTAEVVAFLADQFDVTGVPPKELTTVARVMAIAAGKVVVTEEIEEGKFDLRKWNKPIEHKRAETAPGETIAEVFLNQCAKSDGALACADERIGMQTYAQLKLRAILLADYIHKLPGKYVGIMLPASVAANLIIMACEIAGKVPVMINWTVGPRHLDSVVKVSNVQTVISSWAFLDRLDNVDFNGIEDRLVMVEDIVRHISIADKLKAYFRSKKSTKSILKIFGTDKVSKNDEAVLLFTSGTENLPKGVPLTHFNILSNIRASLTAVDAFTDDVIFGILPPFHSFGFNVSGILGLLSGIRVFYSPNPTEGRRLARGFDRWGVTIMCGAPTFIKGLLNAATPEQLKTMRLCVTGAEKAPPELYQMLNNCGKSGCLIEGYGITECSPVLTMNPIGGCPKGVGKAIPTVSLCIVHPETELPLPCGERGLILAKGPNIFNGYINPGLSSPFTYINGEKWYRTGDLGFMDETGMLTISGRMKRFIKIGGEMVSLASVEEALLHMAIEKGWPTKQEGPTLAICAKEFPDEKPKIFLFTQFDISVDDVNKALKEAGFSNLVKISSVIKLPEIPIMGTGKVNYRLLESEHLSKV